MSNVIVIADNPERIAAVRELFLEYAKSLSFNLCFQSLEEELASLPGDYVFPGGVLLLALSGDLVQGGVALHKVQDEICKLNCLSLGPHFRGTGMASLFVWLVMK